MIRELTDPATAPSPRARMPTRTARRARPSSGRRPRSGEVLGDDADLFSAAYGVTDDGQLGGRHDPVDASRHRRRAGGARFAIDGRRCRRTPRDRARAPARPTARAPAAGPRRQGARGLERARDRGLRRRGRRARGSRERPANAARGRATPTAPPRSAPRRRSLTGSSAPTARSAGRGRTAGRRGPASSRTTRHLADGLLALYEATFDERWFTTARALMDYVLEHFADPAGGFFDTSDRHERLVTRPKDVQDNAVPSGNAMAAVVLLRLHAWTGEGSVPDGGRARDPHGRALRRAVPDRVCPVARGHGSRAPPDRRDRDRRGAGRADDQRHSSRETRAATVRARSSRSRPIPRLRRSRCSTTGSRSMAVQRRTSVGGSSAGCP